MKQDIAHQATMATPPAAVSIVATAQGWTLSDWLTVATLAYIIMQAAYLGWKWLREYRRAAREDGEP